MLGDHGRHPELRDQSQHDLEHILGRLRIELRRRFVEGKRLWMHGEGCGNRHPLTFAAGEGGDPTTSKRVDADLVNHLLDAFTHQRPLQTQVFEAEGELGLDILQHELGVGMLKDETDARAQRARELCPRVKSTHDDPAAECSTGAVRHEAVEAAK